MSSTLCDSSTLHTRAHTGSHVLCMQFFSTLQKLVADRVLSVLVELAFFGTRQWTMSLIRKEREERPAL